MNSCVICGQPRPLDEFSSEIKVCRPCELARWSSPIDLNAQNFIENSGWRLARTMLDIPHQYTVRDLATEDGRKTTAVGHAEFEWFARLTLEEGTRKRWGRYNNSYLTIGGWEYWTMSNPLEVTTIINRQAVGPETKAEIQSQVSQALAAGNSPEAVP